MKKKLNYGPLFGFKLTSFLKYQQQIKIGKNLKRKFFNLLKNDNNFSLICKNQPLINLNSLFLSNAKPIRLKTYQNVRNEQLVNSRFLLQKKFMSYQEEDLLCLNSKVNAFFIAHPTNQVFNFPKIKDKYPISMLSFTIKKLTLLASCFNIKKQYLYVLLDIITALNEIEKHLYSNEIFNTYVSYKEEINYNYSAIKNFYFLFDFQPFQHKKLKSIYASLMWSRFEQYFFLTSILKAFYFVTTLKPKPYKAVYFLESSFLETRINVDFIWPREQLTLELTPLTIKHLLRQKYLLNFFKGQTFGWKINDYRLLNYFSSRLLSNQNKKYWFFMMKKNAYSLKNMIKFNLKLTHFSKKRKYKYFNVLPANPYKQEISPALLYIIQRIEEKKHFISTSSIYENLISLRNFFVKKGLSKFRQVKKQVLASRTHMEDLQDYDILEAAEYKQSGFYLKYKDLSLTEKNALLNSNNALMVSNINEENANTKTENISSFVEENNSKRPEGQKEERAIINIINHGLGYEHSTKLNFTNLLPRTAAFKNISFNHSNNNSVKRKTPFFTLQMSKRNKQWIKYLRYNFVFRRQLWKQKRVVGAEDNINLSVQNLQKYFSLVVGHNVSLIFINALGLAKFNYAYPIRKKGAQKFISYIEREMIQRYKYIAVYIQDFIRICFFSFLLKKPSFLASFMGFQLARLPRNRKETKFIRFLIKVLKLFSAQRPDVYAIKVEFKGRVNRWRRTKVIRAVRGVIPYFTLTTRIEYGTGKSITRKGALGIRLWICYDGTFHEDFKNMMSHYIEYSQLHKADTINKFLHKYNTYPKLTKF